MARRELTGVLLVGGASRRFGSAKALARYNGTTFAEHAWGVLGAACQERVAFGKARDELALPFPVHDDGIPVRAPLAGIVAALRVAKNDVCVFLPVDLPYATPELVRELGEACRDAAARYVDFVEDGLGVGVTLVGTGRERERVLGEHRPAALAG